MGVLDRHRGLRGECRRELCQLFVVEVGFELVDAENAGDAVADDHRRTDPSANARTAVDVTRKVRVLRHVGEDLRPLRPHDLAIESGLVCQVEALAEKGLDVVEAAPAYDHQAVTSNHQHGTRVVGHDPLKLAEDRLDRVLEAQGLPEYLGHGQERLRVLSCALELRDVVVDRVEADVLTLDRERHEHHPHVDQLAVLAHATGSTAGAAFVECFERDVPTLATEVVVENEVVDRPSDRLLRRPTEELRGSGVPARNPLAGVHDDDRHRADLDERLEVLPAPTLGQREILSLVHARSI